MTNTGFCLFSGPELGLQLQFSGGWRGQGWPSRIIRKRSAEAVGATGAMAEIILGAISCHEIASALVAEGGYITGQVMDVNGGLI